jgi:hypothetical protein
MADRLAPVLSRFSLPEPAGGTEPLGSGHIHDTLLVRSRQGQPLYVLQRVNAAVFPDPAALCRHVAAVLAHLHRKGDAALRLIPALDGAPYAEDETGGCWRMFNFVADAAPPQPAAGTGPVREASRAFGRFLALMADYPAEQCYLPLPGFHDIGLRYRQFDAALEHAGPERIRQASEAVRLAQQWRSLCAAIPGDLAAGALPLRIAHNDTKIDNVMLDTRSGLARCVLDLDTVMPGSALYDFGDLIRTCASPAAEDERDLSRVRIRAEIVEAVASGFLSGCGSMLTYAERGRLHEGARLMMLIMGVRFLTDFLRGDVYYKTHYPGQNLDRAQNQLHLLQQWLDEEPRMRPYWA